MKEEKVEVSTDIVGASVEHPHHNKPSSTLTQALTTLLHLHPHPSTLHPYTGYLTKHPPTSQMTLINDFKKEKLKLCKVTPSQFIYSGDTKKTIILTKDTECYAVKDIRNKGDFNFVIISNSISRTFSTETNRNRSEWIKAIHRCIPNESASGLERFCREEEGRIDYLNDVKEMNRRGEYVDYVKGVEIKIPVSRIKNTSQHSSDNQNGTGGERQLWKDFNRDRICINGTLLHGDVDGVEYIISYFIDSIRSLARRNVSAVDCAYAAVAVLESCGRTRSGGDCYDVVNYFLGIEEVVVVQNGGEAIDVKIEQEGGGVNGEIEVGRKRRMKCFVKVGEGVMEWDGVKGGAVKLKGARVEVIEEEIGVVLVVKAINKDVHLKFQDDRWKLWKTTIEREAEGRSVKGDVVINITVKNIYKVCTTDPEGEDSDVWARVEGIFEQEFVLEGGKELWRGEETVEVRVL